MLTCEQCREEIAEYALGQVDPAAAAAVDEHLAACVVCRRELAEVESAWSALALALPPAMPRPEVFDRVLARIEEVDGPRPRTAAPAAEAASPSLRLTLRQRLGSYALAAAVLACLIAGSAYLRPGAPLGDPGNAIADHALHDLAQRLGKVQELEQMLNSGNVRLASLYAPNEREAAGAYVVWDLTAGQWHVFAPGLAQAPAGKSYQLWAVVGEEAPLAGPTFAVGADGLGAVVADFPKLTPKTRVKAVVTLEPAGGSAAPTGDPVLEAPL